jgi:hypothetical protein
MAKEIHCLGVLSKEKIVADGKKLLVRGFSVQKLIFYEFFKLFSVSVFFIRFSMEKS